MPRHRVSPIHAKINEPVTGFKLPEQHTIDHRNCPACKTAHVAPEAEEMAFRMLTFSQAAKTWMLLRRQSNSLKPRSHETTQTYINALEKFFGKLTLQEITAGHLRSYQIARINNLLYVDGQEVHPWKRKAGDSIVNHEISVLGQMLRHCKLWQIIRPFYFPRPQPKWSPREILSEEEEERFFEAAAQHPEAQLAYWVAIITNNTTAEGIELRGLRLKNVFLRDDDISEIYIPEDSVKNDSRPRKIALNSQAKWAVTQCYKRALKLGCCEPNHYLFPFRDRKTNKYIPQQRPSRWAFRRSWDKLRQVTGCPNLHPHDLRHQCITRMLERGVQPETVRAIAGHVTEQMMRYYSHFRRQATYEAVMMIDPKPKERDLKAQRSESSRTTPGPRLVQRPA